MFGINLHFNIERWKFNKEYNIYVSTMGNVKYKDKTLAPTRINRNGYVYVRINTNQFRPLHRIVMETFKGKSDLTIDHVDSNKRNNSLKNLEYVTQEENIRRANEKLIADEVEKDYVTEVIKKGLLTPLLAKNLLTVKPNHYYFYGRDLTQLNNAMVKEFGTDFMKNVNLKAACGSGAIKNGYKFKYDAKTHVYSATYMLKLA